MKSEAILEKSGKTKDDAERARLLEAHNKRKLEDWKTVIEELQKTKIELFDRVQRAKPQEGKVEDYRIPQKGHWVTFPLWNVDDDDNDKFNGASVTVTWDAANTTHNAVYYKTTCWFGDLLYDAVLQPPSSIEEYSNVTEKIKETKAKDTTSKDGTSKNPSPKDAKSKETDPKAATSKDAVSPVPKGNWKASVRLKPYGELSCLFETGTTY